MSGFKDKNINAKIKIANIDMIIDFVFYCLEEMKNDFKEQHKKIPNHEEKIRNCLLNNYLKNNDVRKNNDFSDMFVLFEPEVPENYQESSYIYVGRVDIKVIGYESFTKKDAYNIIECKRIDGTLNLNKKYVNEGIKRFVSDKKYSVYNLQNIMLGFVVEDIDINENSQIIDSIQKEDTQIIIENFKKSSRTNKNEYLYKGIYNVDNNKYTLWNMFFLLYEIIEKGEI